MPQNRAEIVIYSAAVLLLGMLAMVAVTYLLMPPDAPAEPRVITQRDIDDTIGNFIRDARQEFE
jgi:hypothetical protein